jgi:hypothetical protein
MRMIKDYLPSGVKCIRTQAAAFDVISLVETIAGFPLNILDPVNTFVMTTWM